MRRAEPSHCVPDRSRPSPGRAAAAARLAGAADSEQAVADRMRAAAHRSLMTRRTQAETPRPAIGAQPAGPSRPTVAGTDGAAALAVVATLPVPEREAPPRHLTVVPEPGRSPAQRRRRARALLFGGIVSATLVALVLVYFHVVLAQRQFAIDRLDKQVQQAEARYQTQRLQVAETSAPAHIISMAEGQLGMIQPNQVTYLPSSATNSPAAGTGDASRAGGATSPTTVPVGDADWPQIKSTLAGLP